MFLYLLVAGIQPLAIPSFLMPSYPDRAAYEIAIPDGIYEVERKETDWDWVYEQWRQQVSGQGSDLDEIGE